jgi:hypothetical protein
MQKTKTKTKQNSESKSPIRAVPHIMHILMQIEILELGWRRGSVVELLSGVHRFWLPPLAYYHCQVVYPDSGELKF